MASDYTEQPRITQAKQKIAAYCAYQERCHSEVTQKLYSYDLYSEEVEELVAWLITENYLNEERFALAFAGGKFRIKKWGKLKIKLALEQKKVSSYSINKSLLEIPQDDYEQTVEAHIRQLQDKKNEANVFILRNRISRQIIAKGFEPDLVWQKLRTIIPD
jgi:regulatory protein